jgi:hypothetical protein
MSDLEDSEVKFYEPAGNFAGQSAYTYVHPENPKVFTPPKNYALLKDLLDNNEDPTSYGEGNHTERGSFASKLFRFLIPAYITKNKDIDNEKISQILKEEYKKQMDEAIKIKVIEMSKQAIQEKVNERIEKMTDELKVNISQSLINL